MISRLPAGKKNLGKLASAGRGGALLVVVSFSILTDVVAFPCLAVDDEWTATVGMPTRIDQLVIPGSELVVRDLDRESAFVLRIVATFPHGTNHRYDLEYYGLEPGSYDLRDYLRRVDSSSMDEIEALTIEITPILPPGQIEPSALQAEEPPFLGGYRLLLILGGIVWFLGLLGLIFLGRKKRRAEAAAQAAPVTLAERIRPLVEAALAGDLSTADRAELERVLVTFWRRKLGIAEEDPAVALRQLKQHSEAGPLLNKLESWLYQREPRENVNVNELLEPYRHIPAGEAETDLTPAESPGGERQQADHS